MSDNKQINLANNFIQYTGINVFLTGKAGTGKTTFLRRLREKSPKRMIVVAPTGVAAINAGGVTIHSFFQLPFAPYIPGTQFADDKKGSNLLRKEKINIIRSLDLLVIDEISMVRADLLDAIDMILRRYKDRHKPFGGVQLLMIGDLQQLPPVVRDEEWQMLRPYYDSPYFFNSKALNIYPYITIELDKVYRQSDSSFVDILNSIRENRLDMTTLERLNSRYIPDFNPDDSLGYITLTTHNSQAGSINQKKLDCIEMPEFTFKAKIEGDFPQYSYPTDEILHLKKGAQVMFVKNDTSAEKRFYNGKIGHVAAIASTYIIVRCGDENITVEQQEWTNAKYVIDKNTQEITESIEGKFTQYPLKTAWAITIHKSQGLTFDRAIINAGHAFAPGQVYVALSRCRSIEGLVLSTPIRMQSAALCDQTVQNFNKNAELNRPDDGVLDYARQKYFLDMVCEMFDYKPLFLRLQHLTRIFEEHLQRLYPAMINEYKSALIEADNVLVQVGIRFHNQLHNLTKGIYDCEENEVIQDRIRKGSSYFLENTKKIIAPLIEATNPEIDNKELAKQVEKEFSLLKEVLNLKLITLEKAISGFNVKDYLETKSKASIEKEAPKRSSATKIQKVEISSDIQNPELYNTIRKWRKDEADEKNLPVYTILQQKALIGISNKLPMTEKELLSIPGIGKKIVEVYGAKIIEMVSDYKVDNNMTLL